MKKKVKMDLSKNLNLLKFLDNILSNSPIFAKGLALTPIIIGATTLKSSVILIVVLMIIFVSVMIFERCFRKYIPWHFRDFIFAFVGASIYPFASKAVESIDVNTVNYLGIYLPILIVDSIILIKASNAAETDESLSIFIKDLFFTIIWFIIPCITIGFVREILAYGTIWGVVVRDGATLPVMTTSFMGFILIGVLAGLYQNISQRIKKQININQEG
ncbi:MAG: Rnf-Nqr domain containing protein [Oscillospiraceae bacterium]